MELPLRNGKATLIDPEDLPLVDAYQWRWLEVGRDQKIVYVYAETPKGRVYLHRLLCPGSIEVDHRNGDGLDNRKSNLRPATHQQNICNQRPQIGRSSKYKGVSWWKLRKTWAAYIKLDGKKRHLGYFNNEQDAARAYNVAASEAWGEFACLNEIA